MSVLEVDLLHMGVPRAVCAFADLDEGWIVDPGPESTHATLLEALGDWVPERILLTHIHFDHAGATGRLLERWPDAEVWVHEVGAPHLVDPERLVASARRLYGDEFDALWGEVVAVPEERLRVLDGGEPERDGWRVAYTPGHARHHVAYLRTTSGTAFCGDVAGVRVLDGPVFPPTPPPDIDVDAWLASIDVLREWDPQALAVTHFGRYSDVGEHLEILADRLVEWAGYARELDDDGYAAKVRAFVEEHTSGPVSKAAYERANPPSTLHGGLARYWRKKQDAAPR